MSADQALITAIAGHILAKDSSNLLERLSHEDGLPLQRYGLCHIKRIRRSTVSGQVEILLAPTAHTCDLHLFLGKLSTDIPNMIIDTFTVLVSQYMPSYREEFDEWGKHWPVNFHPSEADRERIKGLQVTELDAIKLNMMELRDDEIESYKVYGVAGKGGVMVNPINNKVVTSVSSAIKHIDASRKTSVRHHPLYTPSMICIEGVAALVRGDIMGTDTLLQPNPYLCTGLDLYLSTEPDLMSSMALVHSRIRRVFYVACDEGAGVLESKVHLHQLRALNHKFRVFKVQLL